jgi:hypothetical protein
LIYTTDSNLLKDVYLGTDIFSKYSPSIYTNEGLFKGLEAARMNQIQF